MEILNIVHTFISGEARIFSEETAYKTGTFTNGYGSVGGLRATVTKGASIDLNVDFTVNTISEEEFNEWKTYVYTHLTEEKRKTLEERYSAKGKASWLSAAFGGSFSAGGNYEHYENKTSFFDTENEEFREGFTKKIFNSTNSTYKVTGKVTATGTSNIPTEVTVFVELCKIKFNNGKEISVVNLDNPFANSVDGTTGGVESKPKDLNIVPL